MPTQNTITCRKGDVCGFTVTVTDGGIGAQYTKAKFQVRTQWNDVLPALLSVDETSGISIDYVANVVTIVIGATQTETLPITSITTLAALLRLYDPTNPDDAVSWPIPFQALPDAIS